MKNSKIQRKIYSWRLAQDITSFEELPLPAYLEDIERTVQIRFPRSDTAIIRKAGRQVIDRHANRRQANSGRSVIRHRLAVAKTCALHGLDPAAVAAAILHDAIEDADMPVSKLEQEYGERVKRIVRAVTNYQFDAGKSLPSEAVLRHVMFKRFLNEFRTGSDHLPAVIIKLAERLDHMRFSIQHLPYERSLEMATETMKVYAPLAEHLGIWELKSELEDLAFSILDHGAYAQIVAELERLYHDVDADLRQAVDTLQYALAEAGFNATIEFRQKHVYSTYRKMDRQGKDLEAIYDLVGMRIIVEDIRQCYVSVGIVHSLWKPVAGKFDDYVAAPKSNGYQSLHTTVELKEGVFMEIQIRTLKMHLAAEFGIAAHWRYKGSHASYEEDIHTMFSAIKQHLILCHRINDVTEFIEAISDRVILDQLRKHAQDISIPWEPADPFRNSTRHAEILQYLRSNGRAAVDEALAEI